LSPQRCVSGEPVALWASGVRIPLPAPFLQARFLSVLIQGDDQPHVHARSERPASTRHNAHPSGAQRGSSTRLSVTDDDGAVSPHDRAPLSPPPVSAHGQCTRHILECAERYTGVDQKWNTTLSRRGRTSNLVAMSTQLQHTCGRCLTSATPLPPRARASSTPSEVVM